MRQVLPERRFRRQIPMMTYQTWMEETKRGIATPRSKELRDLDEAFEGCGNTNGPFLKKKALFDKLKDWMQAQHHKGQDWRNSTRNSTKGLTGKGTVERLLDEFAADAYFKPQVMQLIGFTAPPVASSNTYSPGKWDRVQDQDGGWHEFIRQEKGNSCVCATVAMVKRAVHSLAPHQVTEEQIRGIMALEETGNLNQDISALSLAAQKHHDWDNIGTGPNRAVSILRKQPYPVAQARRVTAKGPALLDQLRKCSAKSPGLIGWRWTKSGHFTMCCGPTKDGSKLMIIDPWTGIQYVDNSNPQFASYQGGAGTLGDAIVCH
jgi:hypothetical protein